MGPFRVASVLREADEELGRFYFALSQYAESAAVWKEQSSLSLAAEAESERWLERIEYAETGAVSPRTPDPS